MPEVKLAYNIVWCIVTWHFQPLQKNTYKPIKLCWVKIQCTL